MAMEFSTFASTPSAISHEDSIVRMVLERSWNIGNKHASETAEAYKLTQEYAAQSKSIPHSPLLNGDCLPAIAEKVDEHLSCKDLTLVERIQIKRLQIVDRARQNKLRELEVKFMKQVSIVDEDPNAETRALCRAKLDRARVNSEVLVNMHCDQMEIQGTVKGEDELQAFADMRGAPVKVLFSILDACFFFLTSFFFFVLNR
jgi:hypothetical protein